MSRASSRNAGESEWVNSSFFDEEPAAKTRRVPRLEGSFMDSSFDLQKGCDVKDFTEGDTVPAELIDLIGSVKL